MCRLAAVWAHREGLRREHGLRRSAPALGVRFALIKVRAGVVMLSRARVFGSRGRISWIVGCVAGSPARPGDCVPTSCGFPDHPLLRFRFLACGNHVSALAFTPSWPFSSRTLSEIRSIPEAPEALLPYELVGISAYIYCPGACLWVYTMRRLKIIFPRILPTSQYRRYTSPSGPSTVELPFYTIQTSEFQRKSHQLEKPLLLKSTGVSSKDGYFPASRKWFNYDSAASCSDNSRIAGLSSYLSQFHDLIFPYELMIPQAGLLPFHSWLSAGTRQSSQELAHLLQLQDSRGDEHRKFVSFMAPLTLLVKALEFNATQTQSVPLKELYIAQALLSNLPYRLQDDLPPPRLVLQAGRGDIYSSSIWIGLEPTYTPLHRDPNPNLFCQLCSNKDIRLLSPASGQRLFETVQSRLGRTSNSRFRDSEMMDGQERQIMHHEIWESPAGEIADHLIEAHLGPGDAMFIPLGWWHSVKSQSADGRLNASVNWWFR